MFLKRSKVIARVVAINLAILVAGVVILELVFGNWVQGDRSKRLLVPRSVDVAVDVGNLYDSENPIARYKRDRYGLRGTYRSPERIDILTVGGSTTDQRYLDETATWQYGLARKFSASGADVSVVNAGVDGQAVYGHIKNFDWWFPAIPDLHASYVMLYVGVNDFYCDLGCIRSHNRAGSHMLFRVLEQNSALYNLYQAIKGVRKARNAGLTHAEYRIDFDSAAWTDSTLISDHHELMQVRLDAYAARLRLLLGRVRELGTSPICVTQPIRTHKLAGGRRLGLAEKQAFEGGVRINGLDRYYMMRLLNRRTRDICQDAGAITIDAASEITWEDADFYDVVHNTPQGAAKLAEYLFTKLQSLSFG